MIIDFNKLSVAGTKSVAINVPPGNRTYQASLSVSSGTGTAIVEVYGSNSNSTTDGFLLTTLTLTESVISGGPAPGEVVPIWPFIFFKLVSISGTGAIVAPSVGV